MRGRGQSCNFAHSGAFVCRAGFFFGVTVDSEEIVGIAPSSKKINK